ncbi:MAG: CDP-2,3-bis-(O-geranylgeranyl)-sn-glycerol synthase [Candidatus Lokiarchaeota archaeon]|nr:CDP-2,3-bis-(O-geranylgeranyl)-sn-glycerol synthase [Candidatus Lokiarchaeota archaeon]
MTKINENEREELDKRDVNLMKWFCIIFIGLFLGFILIPIIINLINPVWGWNTFDFLIILVVSLLWTVPALATNATMVIFGRNGKPIDNGKYFKGKRILGDGKTWQGMIGGVLFGFIIGMIIWVLNYFVIFYAVKTLGLENFKLNPTNGDVITLYTNEQEIASFFRVLPNVALITSFFTAFGAFLGDMIGSGLKRRFNYRRGAPLPVVDQLDFISFAMLFAYITHPIKNFWIYFIFMIIFTPLVHLLANIIAYLLKLKKEPW